ncbi:Rne/Rng family ribonuclease [Bartonella sp. DGB2]|uniref:ribonuclease E/G n=1 Tax=Bartonella sp. DGB2 TaxID=3388426 RepID=UPI00399010B4
MLIDASHQEETRVVVVRGSRIEEFDFESEHKKQLKGNIYLARVIRVEPSLQAAFVEYGGDRHGFLPFSEIHPDYYQIPVADRMALLEEEEKAALDESENDDLACFEGGARNNKKTAKQNTKGALAEKTGLNKAVVDDRLDESETGDEDLNEVESVGVGDALEELPTLKRPPRRQYRIQEVIKRRQILLVQVVKEERGNKGAALTTYLSLAGRYSVLMPNTARGGGISRKISNLQDRKRLRDIVKELEVPKGIGVILRTAGANRTRVEIKRDYEYLLRLWENIRNLTFASIAPALVYEEGNLIKRSIRDLYSKDITEILVAGDAGYREAKDFMRMLMPSHAKVVQPYRGMAPIFAGNGIETQLDKMLQPQVSLKSGGYLVINQTEALVAIDVNSGRATREHSIEETAFQTNLEAAEEVARQLRLRDLAGLVVIDFIDMADKRNIRQIEKKLKDCLKEDRARIQVGHISHFGLLEMSRQRIRASVLESTMQPCPRCAGAGHIRSDSSVALHVIRSIEDYLLRHSNFNITVQTSVATALYVLNNKRRLLGELEDRFGVRIDLETSDNLGVQYFSIHKGTPVESEQSATPILPFDPGVEDAPQKHVSTEPAEEMHNNHAFNNKIIEDNEVAVLSQEESNDDNTDSRRRRRRGRRGGRRNRSDESGRQRLPFAEPVGDFADEALAEVKIAARRKYISFTDPFGFVSNGSASLSTELSQERESAVAKDVNSMLLQEDPLEKAQGEENAASAEIKNVIKRKRTRKKKIESLSPVLEVVHDDTEVLIQSSLIKEDQKINKPVRSRRKKAMPSVEKGAEVSLDHPSEVTEIPSVALSPIEPTEKKLRGRRKKAMPINEKEGTTESSNVDTKKSLTQSKNASSSNLAEASSVETIENVSVTLPTSLQDVKRPAKVVEPLSADSQILKAASATEMPIVTSSAPQNAVPRKSGWWRRKNS